MILSFQEGVNSMSSSNIKDFKINIESNLPRLCA